MGVTRERVEGTHQGDDLDGNCRKVSRRVRRDLGALTRSHDNNHRLTDSARDGQQQGSNHARQGSRHHDLFYGL